MALFKTIEEIKDFFPLSVGMHIDDIMPSIKTAERKFILPVVSKAQYNDVHDQYQTDESSLSTAQKDLLEKMRWPLANFAALLYIPVGNVHVGSGGLTVTKTDKEAPASQYRVEQLKDQVRDAGYEGIEELLEFLEDNKGTYTDWATSDAYTLSKKYFINSAKEFSSHFNIGGSRRTFQAMFPVMEQVERAIKDATCTDLFEELKDQILNNTVTADNKKLLDIIKPAVANLTISRAIDQLAVRIDDKGVTVYSSNTTETINAKEPAGGSRLNILKENARNEGENRLQKLEEYLHDNADTYPLYKSSDCYEEDYEAGYENEEDSGYYGAF